MISCPSCRTRYRMPVQTSPMTTQAHCSRCDQRFPLASERSAYRISRATGEVATRSAGATLNIGLDDPTLAPHVSNSALSAAGTADAMTYRVVAQPAAPEIPPLVDPSDSPSETVALPMLTPEQLAGPAPDRAADALLGADSEAMLGDGDGPPQSDSASDAEAPVGFPKPRNRANAFSETLIALFGAVAGAAGGYYGAPYLDGDMMTWTTAGCGVGLVVGWVWIRSMARAS